MMLGCLLTRSSSSLLRNIKITTCSPKRCGFIFDHLSKWEPFSLFLSVMSPFQCYCHVLPEIYDVGWHGDPCGSYCGCCLSFEEVVDERIHQHQQLWSEQAHYTHTLTSARMVVENAFRLWKERWRCLMKGKNIDLRANSNIVATCSILHNVCEKPKEDFFASLELYLGGEFAAVFFSAYNSETKHCPTHTQYICWKSECYARQLIPYHCFHSMYLSLYK